MLHQKRRGYQVEVHRKEKQHIYAEEKQRASTIEERYIYMYLLRITIDLSIESVIIYPSAYSTY